MRYIIAVLVAIMIICTVQVIIHYELLTKHDKFMSQKSQTMYQDQPHAEKVIHHGGSELSNFLKQKRLEYKARSQKIKEVCAKHNLTDKPRLYLHHFLLDTEQNLGYCLNAKVGTTTWLLHFLEWSKVGNYVKYFNNNQTILTAEFYKKIYKHFTFEGDIGLVALQRLFQTKDLFTFTFVRHPFERLVSTFEDKVLQMVPDKKGIQYHGFKDKFKGNFTLFIQEVIDSFSCGENLKCYKRQDQHWARFHQPCLHCYLQYNVIGKMETFDEDRRYILHINNLTYKISNSNSRINHIPHENSRTMKHMKELSHDLRLKLYETYKLDFELFEYDATEYLKENL